MRRPGVQAALELARDITENGDFAVFEAPTGYGKTRLTGDLFTVLVEGGYIARILHGLPLRAIVEEQYGWLLKKFGDSVGYQAGGLGILGGKSPFLGRKITVTTFDSLFLSLARWSLGEPYSFGHYEVPRAHIFSGMVVLDEAHLPLQPDPTLGGLGERSSSVRRAVAAMAAVTYALAYLRVPTLVETATLPQKARHAITERASTKKVNVYCLRVVPPSGRKPSCPGGKAIVVEDKDYFDAAVNIKWKYYYKKRLEEAIEHAISYAEKGRRVFFASSTVVNAVNAYKTITKKIGSDRVALVHGRLTVKDRMESIKKLNERKARILIGTQAVEAGVNYDADVLFTDVPRSRISGEDMILWDSIIQRMGRVYRDPQKRREDTAHVIFYGGMAEKAAKLMKGVNPKLPDDYKGAKTYLTLLDSSPTALVPDDEVLGVFYKLVTRPLTQDMVRELRSSLCNPLRESVLVKAIPAEENISSDDAINKINNKEYLTLSLDRVIAQIGASLRKGGEPWAYYNNGSLRALVSEIIYSERDHPVEIQYKIVDVPIDNIKDCMIGERVRIEAILVRSEAYHEGVGLV